MGLAFTKLFARLFSKKEMRILMVGGGLNAHYARGFAREVASYQVLLGLAGGT